MKARDARSAQEGWCQAVLHARGGRSYYCALEAGHDGRHHDHTGHPFLTFADRFKPATESDSDQFVPPSSVSDKANGRKQG